MKTKNIIIGAGPAGLAMAGRFSKAGMPFVILEQSDKISVKWHEHYDRLCLHTVKQLSALPFMPLPESLPIYVPKQDLVRYYEKYAELFQIKPLFKTKVLSIDKKTEFWEIKTQNGQTFEAENVIVATGINRIPKIPTWSGQENFKGQIIHASQYKNPERFKGKRVLVVGMGNTGAEIALDLAEHRVSVGLSIRNEVVVVPRDLFGRPVQLTAKLLAKLPNFLGDKIAKMSSWIAFGNLKKIGLPISDKAPTAFRRETGRTPTID
jgi:cation diffusion facilitator CzcD-associated flavoprotein CzcO